MKHHQLLSAFAATATLLLAGTGYADAAESKKPGAKTYKWVDSAGVVHYGDHVPPEYRDTPRQVLNEYGVPVAKQDGAKTAEQIAAEKAAAREAEAAHQRGILEARRDRVLLDTYLTVNDIESLRDRRIELINSQIKMTENYLLDLRDNQQKLQKEAANFRPYSKDPNAEPIDSRLAKELATTMDSILLYEKTLQDAKMRKSTVIAQFAADIERFALLKTQVAAD